MELAGKDVVVVGLARSGVKAAQLLARRGARVLATDRKGEGELPAEVMGALGQAGIRLEVGGHRRESFTAADLVVVSAGVPWELPELEAARAAGVPVLAELELAYRCLRGTVAAVTGTKGKSTTTAMIGYALSECGLEPSFVIGGTVRQLGGGSHSGTGPAFIAEACEYDRSFHHLRPKVAIVSVASFLVALIRQLPATKPSISTMPAIRPFWVMTLALCSGGRTRAVSACDRTRLSNGPTSRGATGVPAGGRGASGRSKSSRRPVSASVKTTSSSRSAICPCPSSPTR